MEVKKRFVVPLIGLLMAFTMAVMAIPAYADEAQPRITDNQWYDFYFSYPGATQGTYGVPKDDDTASWITVTNMNFYDIYLYIDGGVYQSGPWTNCTTGSQAYLVDPGDWWIHNYVYEAGYRWARLTGWSPDETGDFEGYWSPDSWGTYPSLN